MNEKIYTPNAPAAIGPYSQAVRIGERVLTSGQIAIAPKSGAIEEADIEGQTRQVCENLKAVLEASGSSLDKVLKTTCFLKDIGDFARFNEVYASYFTEKPARSCVGGLQLPKGALVEIEVIAEI